MHISEQMEEVIEDIISMQSSYDDIQNYGDPMVQMPNTVSEETDNLFILFWGGCFFIHSESHPCFSLFSPFAKMNNAFE